MDTTRQKPYNKLSSLRIGILSVVVLMCSIDSTMSLASKTKNIVIVGGGIQGTSVAYHLVKHQQQQQQQQSSSSSSSSNGEKLKVTILEAKNPASAASGKGGGFMARSWGDGSPTQTLHRLSFDMYETLAQQLQCTSYRKIPVLSVTPGCKGIGLAQKDKRLNTILPSWLDGDVGRISSMGYGEDTAQITPSEFVHKMLEATVGDVSVVLGTCGGVETDQGSERGSRKVTAVKYTPRRPSNSSTEEGGGGEAAAEIVDDYEESKLPADVVIVCAGPWSCAAEDWFQGSVQLPMEGIKSTSIVWKQPQEIDSVDATALFCGEDDRYQTHCKYTISHQCLCIVLLMTQERLGHFL
jgi:hypothetical protein